MTSQAEKILAFVFKRSGKTELTFSDIYLTLSMDLHWFKPDEAKEFVNRAIGEKLLTKKNSQIRPSFDISKIDIPLDFSPKGKLFEEKVRIENKKTSILDQIINKVEKETNEDKKLIYDKIKKIEKEKNLTALVSAVLVGKEFEIELVEFIPEIERKMV